MSGTKSSFLQIEAVCAECHGKELLHPNWRPWRNQTGFYFGDRKVENAEYKNILDFFNTQKNHPRYKWVMNGSGYYRPESHWIGEEKMTELSFEVTKINHHVIDRLNTEIFARHSENVWSYFQDKLSKGNKFFLSLYGAMTGSTGPEIALSDEAFWKIYTHDNGTATLDDSHRFAEVKKEMRKNIEKEYLVNETRESRIDQRDYQELQNTYITEQNLVKNSRIAFITEKFGIPFLDLGMSRSKIFYPLTYSGKDQPAIVQSVLYQIQNTLANGGDQKLTEVISGRDPRFLTDATFDELISMQKKDPDVFKNIIAKNCNAIYE